MISFPSWQAELKAHPATGYHDYSRVDAGVAADWFAQRDIRPPVAYLDFVSQIGVGSFFAGSLVLFEIRSGGNLESQTIRLPESVRRELFAIGYDGTTEGCYCLKRGGEDPAVYWHSWESMEASVLEESCLDWIERLPAELFNNKVYAGYKSIKDMANIAKVIAERAAFEVRIIEFGIDLVRPSGKERDLLARYSRVLLGVRKLRASDLKRLTVILHRTGSRVGSDNKEYVTVDVAEIPAGSEAILETFAFDPFNVPFENIIAQFTPSIDLGSTSRVRFAEIKDYL